MKPLDAKSAGSRSGGPSFSLGARVARTLWIICWTLLARWTPPPLHGWRLLIVKAFGGRAGKGCRIHASVKIWWPGNLELGNNVLIGPGATIYNQGEIGIGSDSVVSQRAHLCASSHDVQDPQFQLVLRPIHIANSCWIATEAFVGPGVTMAEGSVLAARGALFEDAEPFTIYRGNPATKVRKRAPRAGEGSAT